MALRTIRVMGEEVLNKPSKEVKELTERTKELIDDMIETMYEHEGLGLAAPQVGVLKRIAVVDVTGEDLYVMINPRIIETEGTQSGYEGCLSVPQKQGIVVRPNYVKVEALDRDFNPITIEGEELLARALIHEIEHLDGQLFVDKVEGPLKDYSEFEEEGDEE